VKVSDNPYFRRIRCIPTLRPRYKVDNRKIGVPLPAENKHLLSFQTSSLADKKFGALTPNIKPAIAKAYKNSCSSDYSHHSPPHPSSVPVVQIIHRTNLGLYTLQAVDSSAITLAFTCI
jgi:hypothetical protein